MIKNSILGLIVGLIIIIGLSSLIPKPSCRDGWSSGSIGRSGACSHHGGVDRSGSAWGMLIFALSIVGGVITTKKLNKRYPDPVDPYEAKAQEWRRKPPYDSIENYEKHLRNIGVNEDQIKIETDKYKNLF